MLNVGDAVLTFLGDTTQLDQVFARLPADAEASMGKAADSVSKVGDAVKGVSFELDATSSNVPFCGEVIKDTFDKAGGSVREARGAFMLLEHMFGVSMPRELNTLAASIPMLTSAFSEMLPLIGVLAAIAVITTLVEKHQALGKAQESAAQATENLTIKENDHTKSMELSNLKLDDQIARLEGRPEKNKLKEALIESGLAADALATTFSKDFEKVDAEIEVSTGFVGRFTKDMQSWSALLAAGPSTIGAEFDRVVNGTNKVEAALALVHNQLLLIDKLRVAQAKATTEDEQVAAVEALGRAYGVLGQLSGNAMKVVQTEAPKDAKAIGVLSGAVAEAAAAQKDFGLQAENIHKRVQVAALETSDAISKASDKAFTEQAKNAQKEADFEQKTWEAKYKEAVSALQESEKEKIAATLQGSQARLAAIDAAIKEEQSKGLQDTQFYKSLQTQKIQFTEAALAAEQKAVNQAASEQLKRADADAKVEMAQITEKYSVQEKAITQLSSFKLISATQSAHQLEILYTDENNKTIKILEDLLKREQDAVKAAQAKLSAAKDNPFISPQQIDELKKLLLQAEQAEAATQVKIANTTKTFQDKELTLDKGRYGQALAIATAFGNALLAEKLKENHAQLLTAQAELVEAKARGVNTDAIQKEIQALQKSEHELTTEATHIKGLDAAMQTLKTTMKAAATEELAAFSTAMTAMISGQESFGQAMEQATLKMVGGMAKTWAEYYAGLAMADLVTPGAQAKGAGELAASIALFAISGAMSGLAGNMGKTAATATGSTATITQSAATVAAGPGPSSVNVPRLFSGAIVTQPTMAMIGDRQDGGSQAEGVFPLGDPRARQALMDAFGLGGGGTTHNYYINGMISTTDLTRLTRVISRGANTGRVRMSVTNSNRVTRRT
jgi:hypothetical protein